jgi:hypothetical protein
MINYRTMPYGNGLTVHIIEAKPDTQHEFQVSIIGDKYNSGTSRKSFSNFRDADLEAQGWQKIGMVNGGLFFPEGSETFAVGIEKSRGVVNENDDVRWDNVITLYHDLNMLYVAPQAWVKSNLSKFRGAVTGVFGLLNNGVVDTRGRVENASQFNGISGRTIVGRKADDTTMVFASFAGVTGKTGLTGAQTVELAKHLGLRNAVCMDGGGSVALQYNGVNRVNTTRLLKNAVALYVKEKHDPNALKTGDRVNITGAFTVGAVNPPTAYINELGCVIAISHLKKVG